MPNAYIYTMKLKIVPTIFFKAFSQNVDFNVWANFNKINYTNFKNDVFYYNTNSVASSAKIEGEIASSEDLIKYLKHKTKFAPGYINATNDLYNAYVFSQENKLNKTNLLKAHQILSTHLLKANRRGVIRNFDEVIYSNDKIVYTAALKQTVEVEFNKLIADLNTLLKAKLTTKEVFYYAFYISLVFVKIHPFEDGNGRTARLLEKWFIAEKLNKKAWFIKLELNYYNKVKSYFLALNRMGLFYEETNYAKALNISLYTINTLKK